MENSTKNVILGISIGAAVLSLAGVAVCADQTRAVKKMIAGSTEKIMEMSQVDIDRRMVDQLVRKSVSEQATLAARNAAESARNDIVADMRNRVKQVVTNQTSEINKRVAKKVAEEMAEINRDDIIDDVVKQTTEMLVDKLGEDLDNEVGRIGKIYKGIAAALQ